MESILEKRTKELTRTFNLHISTNLINCKKWTREVIHGVENDRLLVIGNSQPLSLSLSDDGFIPIDSYFKIPVSIKEWLPIACQSIRSQAGESDEFDRVTAIACYSSNADEVLFPVGLSAMPPGPVALNAAIVFRADFIYSMRGDDPSDEDKFKFVLAHELVHVFHFMRILVPAFKNWKRFWKVCLDNGDACEEINKLWMYSNCFVDSYGTETELAMIKEYWPRKAVKWFEAFRK